jgi:hypothetical protein
LAVFKRVVNPTLLGKDLLTDKFHICNLMGFANFLKEEDVPHPLNDVKRKFIKRLFHKKKKKTKKLQKNLTLAPSHLPVEMVPVKDGWRQREREL